MTAAPGYFLRRIPPGLASVLDATRAVAAGLVVLHHAHNVLIAPWSEVAAVHRTVLNRAVICATGLGPAAVLVFFVLSGFLVGGGVIGSLREGTFGLRYYLVCRLARLCLVLFPALLLGALCDRTGAAWQPAEYHEASGAMGIGTALGNAVFLQTILVPPFGSNSPLWSLANEFWYYLLWPCLLLPWVRGVPGRLRVGLALAAAGILALTYPLIALYGLIWVAGALVRCCPVPLIRWPWLSWLLLAAVVVGQRLLPGSAGAAAHVAGDFAVGLAFANVLLTCQHRDRPELPATRIFHVAAEFSYSLYLLHMPLLLLLAVSLWHACGVPRALPPGAYAYALMIGLVVVAYAYAGGVAWLTERHNGAVRAWLVRRSGLQR